MTVNLWRAEWLKTRKHPLNHGMLVTMLGVVAGLFVMLIGLALINPGQFLRQAAAALPFPRNLDLPLNLLNPLGTLVVVVFVANNVGSEYGRDTWKAILPRYGSRRAFLITKWAVGLVGLALLITGMIAITLVFGWLGTQLLDLGTAAAADTRSRIGNLGATTLQLVFVGTLTLFGAVATRSTIGAVITGILVPPLLTLLQSGLPLLLKGAPIILPTAHIANIRMRWMQSNPQADAMLAALFNRTVPPAVSLLVVLGYIALMLGTALYLFQRRDLA